MSLERFVLAQKNSYEKALDEIKKGRKRTHWMWYIFPQLKGLGHSSTSQYYGIRNRAEAEAYMKHPVLSERLLEISTALLELKTNDASEVFGYIDDMKLQSSMTLFYIVTGNIVFESVLKKFFNGENDENTIALLKEKE